MLKTKKISMLSASMAIALSTSLGAPTAMASTTDTVGTPDAVATTSEEQEFTETLELIFTEVVVLDDDGEIVDYNEDMAVELVGEEAADELTEAVQQARQAGNTQPRSSQSFVDCMVQNSVLGLVSGAASGAYAELIREKRWDELGQRIWPKVANAGVQGGAVGVAAGLAASSVQCTFWR